MLNLQAELNLIQNVPYLLPKYAPLANSLKDALLRCLVQNPLMMHHYNQTMQPARPLHLLEQRSLLEFGKSPLNEFSSLSLFGSACSSNATVEIGKQEEIVEKRAMETENSSTKFYSLLFSHFFRRFDARKHCQ